MKAITLISGGLDSTLATKLTKDLGIELVALNARSPFCLCNRPSSSGCFHNASQVAKSLGLKLFAIDVSGEMLEIVKNPKHGYGSNMNPCIDCRILLFKKARDLMYREGASFIITGEVLGQRPMSQKLYTMRLIEKEAGLEGLVLRPLSAGVLEPTTPEKQGWVLRDKLLAISGRGRKDQIALANELGIKDYPCPSGGCLLTDPEFSKRLKDLMKHEGLDAHSIQLLKIARHFRLSDRAKLIVGRNEKENERLADLARENDYVFMPCDVPGPTALGRGIFDEDLLKLSCRIISRYCDLNGIKETEIIYRKEVLPEGDCRHLFSFPLEENQIIKLRI